MVAPFYLVVFYGSAIYYGSTASPKIKSSCNTRQTSHPGYHYIPSITSSIYPAMDRYNFTKFSRVKTLLVPVNDTSRADFIAYYDLLRQYNEVRLLDLSPSTTFHFFNPQSYPNGRIFFDFLNSIPDNDTLFLHDFEPFRICFIAIGIGRYTPNTDYSHQLAQLRKLYPASQVHNLILFDAPADSVSETENVYYHNGPLCPNITALETVVCDIAKTFLMALDVYALSYKNITLRSPVSITDSHILTKTINQAQKRLSSGSTSFKASFNAGSANSDANSKSQVKHSGRQSKLMGDFYLLAGNYSSAFTCFIDSLTNLKKCEDYLWLGSSLEGLAVSIILLHYVGSNYELPRQKLCQVLQISSRKLPTVNTTPFTNNPLNRASSESISDNAVNSIKSPRNSATNLSQASPRNSISSTNGVPDISNLALPELIKLICNKALHFYHLSTNDYENMVPDIVYVESILRLIKFMVAIYLGGNVITSSVLEGIVTSSKQPVYESSENTYFLKADILKEIDKIFSLQLVDMNIVEQCRIYCTLATTYSDLGLARKRAFILRVLLVSLVPKLEAKLALNQNDNLDILESLQATTSCGNQFHAIRDIFEYLFLVYGIPYKQSKPYIENKNWTAIQIPLLKLSLRISESIKDYQFVLKICAILLSKFTHCLGQDYQLSLKEKVNLILRLSNRDNLQLHSTYWDPYLVRDVNIVNNRNKDSLIPFQEYQKTNGNIGLMGATAPLKSNGAATSQPVLFDPYNKAKVETLDKDKLLIMNEIYHLKVLLQNPFFFEIEVSELSIVTEGDGQVLTLSSLIKPFNSVSRTPHIVSNRPSGMMNKVRANQVASKKSVSPSVVQLMSNSSSLVLVIGAKSSEYFQVSFKPLLVGDLKIIGFKASISDCEEQFFPIFNLEYGTESVIKLEVAEESIKSVSEKEQEEVSVPVLTQSLDLKVISPQPKLSLTNILITNSWIMLLEGEKYPFSVDLVNYSTELINFLSFSFWDSTIDPLKKRLELSTGAQTLLASEIYELEWLLLKSSPFRIVNKEEIAAKYKTINPQGELKIDFELTGKRGIKHLKIILEYSHKHSDLNDSFVKSISIPINISIFPSFEILAFDLIPLYSFSFKGLQKLDEFNSDNIQLVVDFVKQQDDISQYCLMILDMKNSWNDKLTGKVEYRATSFSCEQSIDANKTRRLLIPIKRISREDVDVTKPIPSLREKQFIKNYSITESEENKMRELFWLRSNLLDNLSGTWNSHTCGAVRRGVIEFRSIRLTSRMAQVLTNENINIFNEIYDDETDETIEKNGNKYILSMDKFYKLKTTIINGSNEEINGVLRQLPLPINSIGNTNDGTNKISIDKKILINGVLQSHLGYSGIKPGDKMQIELGFVIIEKGEYEWGVVLNIPGKGNLVGRESLFISAL